MTLMTDSIYKQQLCENLTRGKVFNIPNGVKIRGKSENTPETLASTKVRK